MKNQTRSLFKRLHKSWRRLFPIGLALSITLLLVLLQLQQADAWEARGNLKIRPTFITATADLSHLPLPEAQAHPLPPTLARWQEARDTGDYFSVVKPTPVGYLVWSQFPVKVYVDRPTDSTAPSSSIQRFGDWVEAVLQAVGEWNVYLPLEVVTQPTRADISILRSRPPIQASINPETGALNFPRARTAETHYEFYLSPSPEAPQPILSHRLTIQLSPDQSDRYTLATARHELGHALGIWGHSPLETDAMYFSQVRDSPEISIRDVNTLKHIYEQPTRLGWPLPEN
jgi:predicted Zn-dependent protease